MTTEHLFEPQWPDYRNRPVFNRSAHVNKIWRRAFDIKSLAFLIAGIAAIFQTPFILTHPWTGIGIPMGGPMLDGPPGTEWMIITGLLWLASALSVVLGFLWHRYEHHKLQRNPLWQLHKKHPKLIDEGDQIYLKFEKLRIAEAGLKETRTRYIELTPDDPDPAFPTQEHHKIVTLFGVYCMQAQALRERQIAAIDTLTFSEAS